MLKYHSYRSVYRLFIIFFAVLMALGLTVGAYSFRDTSPVQAAPEIPLAFGDRGNSSIFLLYQAPAITTTKVYTLATDADGDQQADPGDVLSYTILISNTGSFTATGLIFTDTLDPNTSQQGLVSISPVAIDNHYNTLTHPVTLTITPAMGLFVDDYPGLNPAVSGLTTFGAGSLGGAVTDHDAGDTVNLGSGGTLTVNADGSFVFVPSLNFTGSFSFFYRLANPVGVSDGLVQLLVDAPPFVSNTTPLTGATQISTTSSITITFSEAVSYSSASFALECPTSTPIPFSLASTSPSTIAVLNPTGGLPASAICTVTVQEDQISDTDTNDPPDRLDGDYIFSFTVQPVAKDDTFTIDEDSTGNVLDLLANNGNGVDLGTGLTITTLGAPDQGGTVAGGSTTVVYTPTANFFGQETFTYTIADIHSGTDTAIVRVNVSSINDPPKAVDDTATVAESAGATILNVLANDTDPDSGDTKTVVSLGTAGILGSVINNGSNISYNPNSQFETLGQGTTATEVFSYTMQDSQGAMATATVTITITGQNDAPNAADSAAYTIQNVVVNGILTASDVDGPASELRFSQGSTLPTKGNVSINATTGKYSYTPNAGASGADSFSFDVVDRNGVGGLTDSGLVTVSISSLPPSSTAETLVNQTVGGSQGVTHLAALGNGGFLAFWSSWNNTSGAQTDDGIYSRKVDANGNPAGSEYKLHSFTTSVDGNKLHSVTELTGGGVVAIWETSTGGFNDIFAQVYNADGQTVGSAIPVNTTTADYQGASQTVALSDGRFAVVWQADNQDSPVAGTSPSNFPTGVYARIFNGSGSAATGEFRINQTVDGSQGVTHLAALGNGGFLAFWNSWNNTSGAQTDDGIYSRKVDANGTPVGSEYKLHSFTTTVDGNKLRSVTELAGGGVVAIWETSTGGLNDIFAQVYNADGQTVGTAIPVNTTTADYQGTSQTVALSDGRFAVVWQADNQDSAVAGASPSNFPTGVYARIFNDNGSAATGEFRINQTVDGFQGVTHLAALGNGGFLAFWNSWNSTSGAQTDDGIYSRKVDASGNPVGSEYKLHSFTTAVDGGNLRSVTELAGGGVVAIWETNTGGFNDIFAQVYDAAGQTIGTATPVNTTTSDYQGTSQTLALNGGGYAIAWQSDNQDSNLAGASPGPAFPTGVYMRMFVDSGVTITAGATNDSLQGSNRADTLNGGGGNDWLRGAQSADDLTGGGGADRFDFAAGDGGASVSAADIIQDFQNGTDLIGLVGLTFGQLTINQSQNVVGDATLDTIISITASSEILVVLDGVTGVIDTNDFVAAP